MSPTTEIAAAYAGGSASWNYTTMRNPHAGDDTPRGRVLAAMWQRGRAQHRPHRRTFEQYGPR